MPRGDADLAAEIVDELDLAVAPVLPIDPGPWDLMNEIWPAWVLIDAQGQAVGAFQNVNPADIALDVLVALLDRDLPPAGTP